jgi:hypothetical protein
MTLPQLWRLCNVKREAEILIYDKLHEAWKEIMVV